MTDQVGTQSGVAVDCTHNDKGDVNSVSTVTMSDPAPAYVEETPPQVTSKDKIMATDRDTSISAIPDTDDKADVSSTNKPSLCPPTPGLKTIFESASRRSICAFGPRTSFFYYGGEDSISWTYLYKDTDCPYTVAGANCSTWNINKPYEISLSPHGAGYFAFSSHTDGTVWHYIGISPSARPKKRKLRKQFDQTIEAYSRLREWLTDNVITADDIRTTKVAFGPGARYMAWKQDNKWISNALPHDLETTMKKKSQLNEKNTLPRILTFGVGDTWAAIWHDGSHSLHTEKKYPALIDTIAESPTGQILHISLDACNENSYSVSFSSIQRRYRTTPARCQIISNYWHKQTTKWCRDLNISLILSSDEGNGTSRKIMSPEDAEKADRISAALKVAESEKLAEEAAHLSIVASKKSISASKVAVGAGVVAIATGCSVM